MCLRFFFFLKKEIFKQREKGRGVGNGGGIYLYLGETERQREGSIVIMFLLPVAGEGGV